MGLPELKEKIRHQMDLADERVLRIVSSNETALKIRLEIFKSVEKIIFPEQFQLDEYRLDCRRVIVRNYKVLYQVVDNSIYVVRVFNTFQDTTTSLR